MDLIITCSFITIYFLFGSYGMISRGIWIVIIAAKYLRP